MKFILMVFTIIVIVPLTKLILDVFIDPATGPIYNVTANTSVNGSATTPWGQSALLFWQFFPYIIALLGVIALFRIVSGRLRDRRDK